MWLLKPWRLSSLASKGQRTYLVWSTLLITRHIFRGLEPFPFCCSPRKRHKKENDVEILGGPKQATKETVSVSGKLCFPQALFQAARKASRLLKRPAGPCLVFSKALSLSLRREAWERPTFNRAHMGFLGAGPAFCQQVHALFSFL